MDERKKTGCCCCSAKADVPAEETTTPAEVSATPAGEQTAPDAPAGSCCRHRERTPVEYKALLNRLHRIEGQVRGVRGMLEHDAYCVDILIQVSAVNAALNSFSRELLTQHLRTCVADDLRAGSDDKLDELLNLLPRLMK